MGRNFLDTSAVKCCINTRYMCNEQIDFLKQKLLNEDPSGQRAIIFLQMGGGGVIKSWGRSQKFWITNEVLSKVILHWHRAFWKKNRIKYRITYKTVKKFMI